MTTPHWQHGTTGELPEQNKALIQAIDVLIRQDQKDTVLERLSAWNPIDIVELLIHLPLKRARKLYQWLPPELAAKVLTEINPRLRALLMEEATVEQLRNVIDGMEVYEAVQLLEELPDETVEALVPQLSHAAEISEHLRYPEDSAGALMRRTFVAVPPEWEISRVVKVIRRYAATITKIYAVYVVDAERRLLGKVKLRDLLLNPKETQLGAIMEREVISVSPDTDQEEVARLAERHNLDTIPVLDANRRMIGRITLDELQDVIREEAEEDVKLMSGVSPDALPDESLGRMVRSRLPWLLGGLLGAGLAALVVGSFEQELEQAAILASFIPIVMAMAGNAGIQASTVTVQGLATGNLWIGDIGWRVSKELFGALFNGLVIAIVLSVLIVTVAQFMDIGAPLRLALAAGLALVAVVVIAACFGSTIPLILNHFHIDPAMATGVFITTTNDILSVLIFFLMASHIYLV